MSWLRSASGAAFTSGKSDATPPLAQSQLLEGPAHLSLHPPPLTAGPRQLAEGLLPYSDLGKSARNLSFGQTDDPGH